MKRHDIIFWLFSLCAVIVSCAKDDSVSENTEAKRYEFALSVSHQHGMRMADNAVHAGETFRGLQRLCVIPFRTTVITTGTESEADSVRVDDFPLISIATGTEANKVSGKDYYYIGFCSLEETANRVLVYGQSVPYHSNPALNGQLNTEAGTTCIVPADITFSLQSICEEDDPEDDIFAPARKLADYLTYIAKTPGWSNGAALGALYRQFINADADGTGIMAGSAANVKAYVSYLKNQLEGTYDASNVPEEKALCLAIIERIGDVEKEDSCVNNGYPRTLGLPDGAAALRWINSENAFSVRTVTTTLDNINGIKRYTYPAELWYYTNSAIRTSDEKVGKQAYIDAADWDELLTHYKGNKYITVKTQSVAVKDPLQYGVARLQMTLETISGTLRDSERNIVSYGNASNLPLRAVIVGGQHTVGFDFKPMGQQSDVDACLIYDTEVGSTGMVNTLVLQSYDKEKVPVILEFENLTGHEFAGKDGIIYPGTKFYLIGELDPAGKGEGACANRVFTQDYTTAVAMTVKSLANAYSCMPDLLSARLELGVEVQTQWILSTPTIVKL